MAARIKIIRSIDYMDISDNGEILFTESRKNLKKIARDDSPGDWDVLLDFRRTQWVVSTEDIFNLVEVFFEDKGAFQDKVGLLLLPGVNFDNELFDELCSAYPDIPVRTFTNYEDAIQWFYAS